MEVGYVKDKARFHAPDAIAALAGKRVAIIRETARPCFSPDTVTFMVGVVPLDILLEDLPDWPMIMVHPRYLEPADDSAAATLESLQTRPLEMVSQRTH